MHGTAPGTFGMSGMEGHNTAQLSVSVYRSTAEMHSVSPVAGLAGAQPGSIIHLLHPLTGLV